MACTCLVKFLIYAAIWIVRGLSFPARSRAGDIDECVSLDLNQNQRIQQTVVGSLVSIGIRTTGKYRTLVRELRGGGERGEDTHMAWAEMPGPGDNVPILRLG